MKTFLNYILFFFSVLFINAQSSDITVHEEGVLKTHPDSQIGIFGNLNNNGSFTENLGEVGFYNQEEVQNITGTNPPEISDLVVDVPNDLNIEVNTIVNTGVFFTQGRVFTPRIDPSISLDLVATDLYINESDDTHVDGYTSYTGENEYSFPIGDNFRLRPLIIEATAATNTSTAAYFYEDPDSPSTFASFDRAERNFDVGGVSPIEFWDLDGDIETRVTLTWDSLSSVTNLISGDNTLNDLFVVGWSTDNEQWVKLGNTNINGDENSGFITSEPFVPNDYEVITFGGPSVRFVTDEEIYVFNAISANGDDLNAYFRIAQIEDYPNNTVRIFNRWGVKVFEKEGYPEPEPRYGDELDSEEVFIGFSNGRATVKRESRLPTGTYFYVIDFVGDGGVQKRKAGYLYLND